MSKTQHPIRSLPILVYTGRDDSIALIGDGLRFSFPYFRGATDDEARGKAEKFVNETIASHEAGFVRRAEAAEKARASRAKKEASS